MKTIIVSRKDIAGMHMYNAFINKFGFKKTSREFDSNPVYELNDFQLVLTNEVQIYADCIDKIDSELFIFASRHSGSKPCLTVHPIGNYSKAELGGKDYSLVSSAPFIMKTYLQELAKRKDSLTSNYEVCYEVTHHGPFLSKPTVFIELGCSEKEWNDVQAAELIASIVVNSSFLSGKRVALGIGDLHYSHYFTKISLHSDIAFSHMISKYQAELFSEEVLQKMIQATPQKIDLIAVDFKSLGKEKQRIKSILEGQKIPFEDVRKFK